MLQKKIIALLFGLFLFVTCKQKEDVSITPSPSATLNIRDGFVLVSIGML